MPNSLRPVVLVAVVGVCLIVAGPAAARANHPVPANNAWQSYVEANGASTLAPVAVTATGDVTNPNALVSGNGVTTLTDVAGQPPPTVVLDYGREVGGLPFFKVASVTPGMGAASVTMRAGYSEVKQYMFGTNGAGYLPSAPGGSTMVTGDANGNNGVGTDNNRYDDYTLTSASGGTTVTNAVSQIQGGERYEAITLTSPGTVAVSAAGITAKFNNLGAGSYQGYFLSSDDTLNRIWYDGVYTAQTDAVPTGATCASATSCNLAPTILDGAKRDRRPWAGDLSVEGRTLFDSLGFGAGGSDYIKYAIGGFGSAPVSDGSVCGQISDWTAYPKSPATCSFYSPTYSMYYPINLAEYYLYSGDTAFAESQYQVMKNELAYNVASIDSSSGLTTASGSDWDFYDGNKGGSSTAGGAVTATNMLCYEALSEGAWLADQLAAHDPGNPNASTWRSDAASWTSKAAALKTAINAKLFNRREGVYQLSSSDNDGTNPSVFAVLSPTPSIIHPATAVPQDANAQAIMFGVAPPARAAGILAYLKRKLWGTHGPEPYSSDAGYSTIISPFVSGFELDARFATGDTAGALELMRLTWAQMVKPAGPFFTGTLWEKLGQNGQITDSNASLAHGWATAPVSALSSYVLGVQPASPGYRTWTIAPQTGGLAWAQGKVPTPAGPIVSRWKMGGRGGSFRLTVSAPRGTSGTVSVPLLGPESTVARNGRIVWAGGHARRGVRAAAIDGRIVFSGMRGTATFAEAAG